MRERESVRKRREIGRHRQTDRQTDRQTHAHGDRRRDRETDLSTNHVRRSPRTDRTDWHSAQLLFAPERKDAH